MSSNPKILVIRTDRLGDVLMTLPVLDYLRQTLAGATLHFLCAPSYRSLLTPFLDERQVTWVSGIQEKYDAVLMLFGQSEHWWGLRKASASLRVGLYSKPLSFLWLNGGKRQKRSLSTQSEALYNLDLAQVLVKKILGVDRTPVLNPLELPVHAESQKQALFILKDNQILKGEAFTLFHPGMGGSALNISVEQYLSLMEAYEKGGKKILLSVGPLSRDGEIKAALLNAKPNLKWFSGVELPVLAEIFRLSQEVLAPSTGPLHLAHYVGRDTVGIFPPIQSQNAKRWAPFGGKGKVRILSPQEPCPATKACLGSRCQYHDCMKKTPWAGLLFDTRNGLTA